MARDISDVIDVLGSGAVVLGPDVTCDGFHQTRAVRVQSHIHSDHMADFSTSKSRPLVMTEPVKDLLSFDHPDFQFRSNIHTLSTGETLGNGSSVISIEAAGHMLGACQVAVQLKDGLKLGYSGDFSWPMDNPILVDALVVDATYGTPSSDRPYDQPSVDEALADLVRERIRLGAIQLAGNPGVIERALMVINMSDAAPQVPILANSRLRARVDVHRKYGWSIGTILDVDESEGRKALKHGRYIRCWHLSEGGRIEGILEGTTITLTKYRARSVVEKNRGIELSRGNVKSCRFCWHPLNMLVALVRNTL